MKRSGRSVKTASNLSESVSHQLISYALGAGAAGVGAMALSHSAEAKIVYTPIHRVIGPHSSLRLDLNHDGIADFTLRETIFQSVRERASPIVCLQKCDLETQLRLGCLLVPGLGPARCYETQRLVTTENS